MKKNKKGLFITFEGPEGSGKSTQAKMLGEKLIQEGYKILYTREPGGTPVGEELRRIVKHVCGKEAVCDEAEILIFCASRAQHVKKLIQPHLKKGGIIICDRFADSTTAYQGSARGINKDMVNSLHNFSTSGTLPELTFLLDLEVEKGFKRTMERENPLGLQDRIEDESREFHHKVRNAYLQLAKEEPNRITTISADADKNDIHNKILSKTLNFIKKSNNYLL